MGNIKAITKWLLGAALATGFALAVPHQAQAQARYDYGHRDGYRAGFRNDLRHDRWERRGYYDAPRFEGPRYRHDRWERERFGHRFDRRY